MTEQDPINVADLLVGHGALRAEIDGLGDLVARMRAEGVARPRRCWCWACS